MTSPASTPSSLHPVGNGQTNDLAMVVDVAHEMRQEDEEDAEEEEDEEEDGEDSDDDEEDGEEAVDVDETDEEKDLRVVSEALAKVRPSGDFFVCGERAVFPQPGIVVEGFGDVGIPLAGEAAKALISKCHLAPYGLGEQTLVDTQVRDTWEVSAEQLQLENPAWDTMVQSDILASCRVPLGIPEETQVQAKLYKMLLYEAGGKFEQHQDSEKEDGMFGTLVIVLPGRFEGGELVVQDPSAASSMSGVPTNDASKSHVWDPAATGAFAIKYAAFYGDCPHEVKPVTKGYRLCLTYNLVNVDPQAKLPRFDSNHVLYEALKQALYQYFWDVPTTSTKRQRLDEDGSSQAGATNVFDVETQYSTLLASVLSHKYTKAGLSFKYLKNKDQLVAQCLARFCEETDGAFTLYLSKLRYRFNWHGHEESWYDGKSEKGVTRTLTLLYPWIKYGDADDDKSQDDDAAIPTSVPSKWDDDGLEVDPATQVAPKGMFSRPKFRFDGKNEQMYTGNDGANIEKWYSSAALVLVSLKQDAEWTFTDDTTDALKLFVKTCNNKPVAHARAMAAVFSDVPQKWSLLSNEGVEVIEALDRLGSVEVYKNILASCLSVEFQPKLRCIVDKFDVGDIVDTLKSLDKSWTESVYEKFVPCNRVNLVTSILDGVTDPALIESILDAVTITPHYAEPVDFDAIELGNTDTHPEAYARVLRLAFSVSVDRVKALLQTPSPRTLVAVVVPAGLLLIEDLDDGADATAVQAIAQHLHGQLEAALPPLRNLAFALAVPSYLFNSKRVPYEKLKAFGESDDVSVEYEKMEFESTIQPLLKNKNWMARVIVEPLETTVRVTKNYECKALLKAKEQLATLAKMTTGEGK